MVEGTRIAYAAPLRNSEATRCREILETVQCPFVVQIWDFSDETLNEDYSWLFARAVRVFCLSETMVDVVQLQAPANIGILRFTRNESEYKAKYLGQDTFFIGLVGFLPAYQDGLDLLGLAVSRLQQHFRKIRVRYIGSIEQMNYIPDTLKPFTEHLGFHGQAGVDAALATCNAAYLPGPLRSPDIDLRSRHSVPSRSADYMAVGLPIIAAVHPASATNLMFSQIRGRGFFMAGEADSICEVALSLRDKDQWSHASLECSAFFKEEFNINRARHELSSIVNPFL
jgi:glycosyltransferase involved in cell wall biosynthesis